MTVYKIKEAGKIATLSRSDKESSNRIRRIKRPCDVGRFQKRRGGKKRTCLLSVINGILVERHFSTSPTTRRAKYTGPTRRCSLEPPRRRLAGWLAGWLLAPKSTTATTTTTSTATTTTTNTTHPSHSNQPREGKGTKTHNRLLSGARG